MKHTRIIHSTVAFAALVVGSACSSTTTTEPPDAAVGAMSAAHATTTDEAAGPPAATTTPVDELDPDLAPSTDTGAAEDESMLPELASEPTSDRGDEPAGRPAPEPSAEPADEPVSEPADDEPHIDAPVFELADLDGKVGPKRPRPPVRLPSLDIAFAPCGAYGPLAGTASAITTAMVDAVGDGSADDSLTSYLDGDEWALRLTTGAGVISEYTVADVGPGFVEALGAVQLDGEIGDQFLAVVGSNASNLRIGAFGADQKGCIVRFVDQADGEVEFQVGGSIGQLNGVACDAWNGAGYLESLSAVDIGGDLYNVYGTTWHKAGVNVLEAADGTHLFGLSFEDAESVSQLDCLGLTL